MEVIKPHAALLASPGMGHLIPVLELGKSLAKHHGFHVTVFVVAADGSKAESQLLDSQSPNDLVNIVPLPVDISGTVDMSASIVTKIIVMMLESLPILRSKISQMKHRPTCLIVDMFGTPAYGVADEFKMLKFMFITTPAWFLALTVSSPVLDSKTVEDHVFNHKPLKVPGCNSVRFEDTIDPFVNFNENNYGGFVQLGLSIPLADGILVNTWEDLEPTTLRALRDSKTLGRVTRVPVYTVGPLTRSVVPVVMSDPVLDWLDKQPTESVLYVSFGSGGTLSAEQMTELAWGLELSQQRFVWVVRPPMDDDVSGTFFTVGNEIDGIQNYLPDGFLSRTHMMGFVVPMWAPQTEILAHPSVGGFLTHCGWNSSVESIMNGVPMIAWPLYAEQKMNAAMLTEELGVAVRPKAEATGGVVRREEIEKLVRKIMVEKDGHAIRKRVKELKSSGQKALAKNGSSYNSFSELAKECQTAIQLTNSKGYGA